MTHDEMIAVIQAHKDGKKIQYKTKNDIEFCDCNKNIPAWEFNVAEYRVKPEEKKLVPHWPAVFRHQDDKLIYVSIVVFSDIEKAKNAFPETVFLRLATEYPPIMLEVKE